ncbi:hypothetical protein GW17_00046970 [Ensete ventricosum]|nr:hypothetical protein GW17_00046970 [Ensete ventricosum]
MARTSARAAGHGLATYKGAIGCGQGPLQRDNRLRLARKGGNRSRAWSLVARHPQQWLGPPPVGTTTSVIGAVAPLQGDYWQTKAAVACAGHPFEKRTILPLRI